MNDSLTQSTPYTFNRGFPTPEASRSSITDYDPLTRREIRTAENKAALSSLYDVPKTQSAKTVDLFFGPEPPGKGRLWIRTLPDRGWFAYFRICGPQEAAFDGHWILDDFEEIEGKH